MKILPETRFGKWAVILAGVFVLGIIITFIAAQVFFAAMGMLVVALGFVIGGVGTAALMLCLISLFKNHERSFLALLSLLVGLLALMFLVLLIWLMFSREALSI